MTLPLLEIAVNYAKRGWPILPLHTPAQGSCSCGFKCASPGKHPRITGGVHAASTDLEIIKSWWHNWPKANIGIATGSVSNLIVIDLDERHGGVEAFRNWEKQHSAQTGLISKTGGGFHLFFAAHGHQVKSRVGILPGVDVRAEGGFVVAPGSLHRSGLSYSWVSQETNDPTPVSLSLLNLIETQRASNRPMLFENTIPQGQRNDLLARIAGVMRREDCNVDLISQALCVMNQALCSPALEQNEVQAIAHSISRYAPKWGEMISPTREAIKVPELDLSALPSVMRHWVSDAAERMQVPPDFFAAPCLVAFASVLGRQVSIYPKQEDSWSVVPNLWGAIIARPGLFKSPAILEATSFVRALAEKASAQYEVDFIKSDVNAESIKSQIDGLKEAIKKAAREQKTPSEIDEIQAQMQSLRAKLENQSCIHKRFIVNDSTVEKLSVILKENPNGVLLLRDELAGWGASLNRREGDREFYLESWNGNGSFTVDRIGRGTLHVPNLCLSIFGGIQPSKLDSLCSPSGGSDGLLQRFQILVFPDTPKSFKNIDRKPNSVEHQALADIFAKASNILALYPQAKFGLRYSMEAQPIFTSWRNKLELKLRSGEIESEDLESHLSKYRSLVPSLSLLFELIEALSQRRDFAEVGVESITMAINWAHYLELHAQKLYQETLSVPEKGALLLAKKIKSGTVKDGDSLRSIYRRHWSWLDTPEKLDRAIARLEECGWVLVESISNATGKSSVLRVNPKVGGFVFHG